MAVGGPEAQYAAADAKNVTGSVWLGVNKRYPYSLDFFFQGGGEGVEECIDESGGYTYYYGFAGLMLGQRGGGGLGIGDSRLRK